MLEPARLAVMMFRPSWSDRVLAGSVRRLREGLRQGQSSARSGRLWLAPEGRYRADLTDGDGHRSEEVCDGQLVQVVEDGNAGFSVPAADSVVPFTDLLNPAWILAGFRLEVTGTREHAGRPGIAITGHERRRAGYEAVRGGRDRERIVAVVDADLGILLCYERHRPDGRTDSAEFTELRVEDGNSADPAFFRLSDDVRPAAEDAAAGPAAPADLAPKRPAHTLEESISDELIEQLYGAPLGPRRFSAVLHEQADTQALAAMFRAQSSGRGRAMTVMSDFAADHLEQVGLTAKLHFALPGSYRIEVTSGSVPGPACVICDGKQRWEIFADRVLQSPSAPPPAGLGTLLDLAWLLAGYRLAPRGPAEVTGRSGNRVTAEPTDGSGTRGSGVLSSITFPADKIDLVVDAEFGIALSMDWSWQGRILFRTRLSDISDVLNPAVFEFQPAQGARVINASNPLAAVTAKDTARSALKAASLFADIAKRASKRKPQS
jgi:outer membrane lipoprotein-sorting protein